MHLEPFGLSVRWFICVDWIDAVLFPYGVIAFHLCCESLRLIR